MKIIGRFYFKQTQSGNLIGEFSNNLSSQNLTECANLIISEEIQFCGTFKTSWFESNVNSLDLRIELKAFDNRNIYNLNWFNNKKEIVFWGEGFVVDNILIGDYRNFEKI